MDTKIHKFYDSSVLTAKHYYSK